MITISQAVDNIIRKKPFILEAIADGIINYSALAKFIKPEIEKLLTKSVNEGAIIMSLRRIETASHDNNAVKVDMLMKKMGDIVVRSNLVDYTFRNSETLLKKQQKLLNTIGERRDFFYAVTQGVFETTFVISDLIRDDIPAIFEGEKLISYSYGLSSITLKLPTENTEQPGLYYYIFRRLAWEGINILEVISTSNEFTIILKDIDVDRAFSVVKRLKN
ncbi:MAG TPA: aspartate kinase [Bacteroidales bacterium]|nr:aspartate kinase [Bacteroidales bacterium]